MPGLFDGTPLERPVTCERCGKPLDKCQCPRNAAGEIMLTANQPARVWREKRGGKIVTVVTGLDPKASDLPALLKQFRTTLGAGGTVKNGAIEIQGDHRDGLVERLRAMGYPAKAAGG
jgi:translation initiation factor 1